MPDHCDVHPTGRVLSLLTGKARASFLTFFFPKPPSVVFWDSCPGHMNGVGGLAVETRCLGNRMAGLGYWVAGSNL